MICKLIKNLGGNYVIYTYKGYCDNIDVSEAGTVTFAPKMAKEAINLIYSLGYKFYSSKNKKVYNTSLGALNAFKSGNL